LNSKVGKAPQEKQCERRDDSCYKVVLTRQKWPQSKSICESLGGHLVFINSQKEQSTVIGIIQEAILKDPTTARVCQNAWTEYGLTFHIGAKRNPENCSANFFWNGPGAKNQALTYTNWDPVSFNCKDGIQYCSMIHQNSQFRWNDIECEQTNYSFSCAVCEFD